MTKQQMVWGPWNAGYNNIDSTEDMGPNELTDIENLEISEKGVLRLRRPAYKRFPALSTDDITSCNVTILGTVNDLTGMIKVTIFKYKQRLYLMYPGENLWEFHTFDIGTVPTIDDIIGALLFDGRYYLIGKTLTSYVSDTMLDFDAPATLVWTELVGPFDPPLNLMNGKIYGTTWTIYRNRLFIGTEDSFIYYSKANDFTNWVQTAGVDNAGAIQVGIGPGESISFIHNMNNSVYVFTKNNTYTISYTLSYESDGYFQRVNSQGANAGIWFDENMYVVTDTGLALYANNIYYYQNIRTRVPLDKITGLTVIGDYLGGCSGTTMFLYNPKTDSFSKLKLPWDTRTVTTSCIPTMTRDIFGPWQYTILASSKGVICIPYSYFLLAENQFYDVEYDQFDMYSYNCKFTTTPQDLDFPEYYKRPYYGILIGTITDQKDSAIHCYDYGSKNTVMLNTVVPEKSDGSLKFKIPSNRAKSYYPGVEMISSSLGISGVYINTKGTVYDIPPRIFECNSLKYMVGTKAVQSEESE